MNKLFKKQVFVLSDQLGSETRDSFKHFTGPIRCGTRIFLSNCLPLAPSLVCKWFESFLSNPSIKVEVDGIPYSFYTNAWVTQGTVISPTFLSKLMNDLLNFSYNPIHCHAEDSILHNAQTSQNIASSFNYDLTSLNNSL